MKKEKENTYKIFISAFIFNYNSFGPPYKSRSNIHEFNITVQTHQ